MALIAAPGAFAGHPMLSEDTGTQGRGNAELEIGYAWSREDATEVFLFQPQISFGTSASFDLILPEGSTGRFADATGTFVTAGKTVNGEFVSEVEGVICFEHK